MALPLGGQSAPHLLQLALQPADHLGEVLQLAGVELLRALQRILQAFLLRSRRKLRVSGAVTSPQQCCLNAAKTLTGQVEPWDVS